MTDIARHRQESLLTERRQQRADRDFARGLIALAFLAWLVAVALMGRA